MVERVNTAQLRGDARSLDALKSMVDNEIAKIKVYFRLPIIPHLVLRHPVLVPTVRARSCLWNLGGTIQSAKCNHWGKHHRPRRHEGSQCGDTSTMAPTGSWRGR
jgi:hypothetical protein